MDVLDKPVRDLLRDPKVARAVLDVRRGETVRVGKVTLRGL